MPKKTDFETVTWTGTAGIEQAAALRDSLLQAFEKSPDVRLDISGLEDIDITGIQLIIAARREAEKRGAAFRIVGEIPAVISEFAAGFSVMLVHYAQEGGKESDNA